MPILHKRRSIDSRARSFARALLLLAFAYKCGGATASAQSMQSAPSSLRIVRLRCEYADNPLGIDNRKPRLSWELVSRRPSARNQRQRAYRILVSTRADRLAIGRADLWDSVKVASARSVAIEYGGRPLQSGMRAYWSVQIWDERDNPSTPSSAAWWEMGLLRPTDWRAKWIGPDVPKPKVDEERFAEAPAPLLRKAFQISKPILSARAYVSGLGYFELSLNGAKVGKNVLDPGWTAYGKRVLYSTFDVTSALRAGENVAGVMMGNGFYDPLPLKMWGHLNLREHLAIGAPRARVQLEIVYKDGSRQTVATDSSWKTHDGPIRKNSVYLGEQYDARKEVPGWDRSGLDDSNWQSALIADEPGGVMSAQFAPPIRVTRTFPTRKIIQLKPGLFIFDLGTNFAGWARLRVRGATPGTRITMRYGELLRSDGALNPMTSVAGQIKGRRVPEGSEGPSTAVQTDVYTCKGDGREVYTPRFTFHGFRYVEVSGLSETPSQETITGLGLNSEVELVGSFTCSNPLLNQIQAVTQNTFLSNLFSVQSDCPHREKFGYGGDIVATCETAMFNFDMARFYEKSILDLADSVRPNGGFTETSPYVGISDAGLGGGAGPVEWGTAHPQLVWQRYVMYGDLQTLKQQYPEAQKWLALLRSKAVNGILDNGIGDHETLAPKSTAVTGTLFYYINARLLEKMARALGHAIEAQDYDREAAAAGVAFNHKFLKPGTGRYDISTQACQAMALAHGLVIDSERTAAVDVLVREVEGHNGHLTTGIFGTPALLDALTESGHADTAYRVAAQTTFPSWGWMLQNGATSLWEHWELSDNTYSHNHPMFGSVSGWFMKGLAGISPDPEAVGFDKVTIKPSIVDGLTWVRGSYQSVCGPVLSEWHKLEKRITLRVVIPPNTRATVYVPAARAEDVQEGKALASKAAGVKFAGMNAGSATYGVGSGEYFFTVSTVKHKPAIDN